MAKRVNYIDKEQLYNTLKVYLGERELALAEDREPPTIPNFVGECIIKIANKIASRYNFYGYTYKDEMISDGILSAFEATNKFDPERSTNPFGFYTTTIFWAFIRRIEHEKKEVAGRDSLIFDMDMETCVTEHGDKHNFNSDDYFMFKHGND